jgi:antirestriction protein ArdC
MMREYTVFNVDQCENLPGGIKTGRPILVRNDTIAQPNDPQPMKEAIDTLNEMGVILEISI